MQMRFLLLRRWVCWLSQVLTQMWPNLIPNRLKITADSQIADSWNADSRVPTAKARAECRQLNADNRQPYADNRQPNADSQKLSSNR